MFRINKKGFTLVELLAIIVILAIILVITVPQVFKAVDNSKKSSLESSAASLAKWYNTTKAADALVPAASQVLTGITATSSAACIPADLFTKAEVSANDFKTDGTVSTGCSQYKLSGNAVEIILVAKDTGKFYVDAAKAPAGAATLPGFMWANSNGTHSW